MDRLPRKGDLVKTIGGYLLLVLESPDVEWSITFLCFCLNRRKQTVYMLDKANLHNLNLLSESDALDV